MITFCVLSFFGCERNTTTVPFSEVSLSAEFVAVTEVVLRLKVDLSQAYNALQLFRDEQPILTAPLSTTDTTLLDTTLLPSQTYTYQVVLLQNTRTSVKSNELTLTTMETSSHEFKWQTHTICDDPIQTKIFDVSIIDANNIWVAGEIFFQPDSLGNSIQPYSAARWNGVEWEYHRVYLKNHQGTVLLAMLSAIFAFEASDVWTFCDFGSYGHWNGSNWDGEFVWERLGGILKIWGSASNNLYFAGTNGNITHFDGTTWSKMESKTDVNLWDISGFYNHANSNERVYACGLNNDLQDGMIIGKISSEWEVIDDGIAGPVSSIYYNLFASIWSDHSNHFYVTSYNHVYKIRPLENDLYDVKKIHENKKGIYRIRGNDSNDIFVIGERLNMNHYNGLNWHHYAEFDNLVPVMKCLDFKGDVVVAAGYNKVIIGKR
jgi:hypothetical protein